MIFADSPYFLSGGGISYQSGKVVCVDKGDWDKPVTSEELDAFNLRWLTAVLEHMKDNATIWISGTHHNIFSVQQQLLKLGFKVLNIITWAKTNPPPNISCRYFTFSTEFIIWARKSPKVPHYFNYALMKKLNGDKQMTDVWQLPSIGKWENRAVSILLRSLWVYWLELFRRAPSLIRGFSIRLVVVVLRVLLQICWGETILVWKRIKTFCS